MAAVVFFLARDGGADAGGVGVAEGDEAGDLCVVLVVVFVVC